MLISTNKYDEGDIVSFKLVNGDEIVGKVVEDRSDSWVLHKPCTVLPSPKGIGLIQSLFTADQNKNVSIREQHVMMHTVTTKEVGNYYLEVTTGIKPVTSGSIVI
jgi:hypothetical protein